MFSAEQSTEDVCVTLIILFTPSKTSHITSVFHSQLAYKKEKLHGPMEYRKKKITEKQSKCVGALSIAHLQKYSLTSVLRKSF